MDTRGFPVTFRARDRSHVRPPLHRLAAILAAVLLLLLLLCGETAATAASPRIVNGLDTHDFPTTGALLYGAGGLPINADNAIIYCSGTLIGCGTFLTAAHCVVSDLDPTHYWVYLQHGGIVPIASVAPNPAYTGLLGGNDVAIVKLATDVTGIAPTPINATHDLTTIGVGLAGTIAGFGQTSFNGRDFGIKRGARLVVQTHAGTTRLDVALAAGAYAGKGTRGWIGNRLHTVWTFRDTTVSPADGIISMQVKDLSKKGPREVSVKLAGRQATYPLVAGDEPVHATVVLGNQTDGAAGYCGESAFVAGDCAFNRKGDTLVCKR